MASSFPDPFQMWRDALTKIENEANDLGTGVLKSPEVVRSLNQFASLNIGLNQVLEKALERYLHRANLPTRKDVEALAEALQRIEARLDQALGHAPVAVAVAAAPTAPRPARTRKPSAAPAPAPAAAKAKRTRGAAKKG
ncbi:MAG: hypothetical protein QM569_06025 [Acidovorax sp.]|uniref:hypothetical protein n=1 Tax=Acidovorax sp. TaxID=1872122 RepID=UPI0039E23F25